MRRHQGKLEHVFNYYTRIIICCWHLAPLILLKEYFQDGLKYLLCSTEWIKIFYKGICGNILMVWSRSFMISMHHKVTETANSQRQTIKPTYFIIRLSIEYTGIYR